MSGKFKWGSSGSGSSVRWGSINTYTSDDGKYTGKYGGGANKTHKTTNASYLGISSVPIAESPKKKQATSSVKKKRNSSGRVYTVDSASFYKVVKKKASQKGRRRKGKGSNTASQKKTPYFAKIIGDSIVFKEIVEEISSEGAYILDIPDMQTELNLPLNCPVFFQAKDAETSKNDLYKFSNTICTIKHNHMRLLLGVPQRFNVNISVLDNYELVFNKKETKETSLFIEIHQLIKK